jgi:hypothetical protein
MWSLGNTLHGLAKHGSSSPWLSGQPGHSFALFAGAKELCIHRSGRVVLEAIATTFLMCRWSGKIGARQGSMTTGTEPGGEECKWEAGLVFEFSHDSTGHGFVGRVITLNPNAGHSVPVVMESLVLLLHQTPTPALSLLPKRRTAGG